LSTAATKSLAVGNEPTGLELVVIVFILAMANFVAVLDLTIANVLVPQIAGSLAASQSDGVWVITGYGVAEAIMVPLTGWIAERFGPVRVLVLGVFGFGIFSFLCGVATSLNMLIVFRVALGICGGPLIPLSQTLLIKIVPKRHAIVALACWSITTIVAPIIGPVVGGLIADHYSWQWAFYFKVPLAGVIGFLLWRILTPHETPTQKLRIDYVGLGLLVLWVGVLQVMLGSGQDRDWFNSNYIVTLLIVTVVGFVTFVIWETTDQKPIVDLRIFGNRAFAVSMVVIAIAFSSMFGGIVLVPLWLQTSMGYTATSAGYNQALSGVTMILAMPLAAFLMTRFDLRAVACVGLLISSASSLMRVGFNDQMSFWQMMWPQYVFGAGMAITILPLMEMSTASLQEKDIASGTGQFNFIRTLASALSAAAVVALWINQISVSHAALTGAMHNPQELLQMMESGGMPAESGRTLLDYMVSGQSVMQATNNTFLLMGLLTLAAAAAVWLVPKPPKKDGSHRPMMH
jgi:DHA2 family multidrug resistance protein